MFTYTLDSKSEIKDSNGNTIVDFITPLFNKNSTGVKDYMVRRINADKYVMRPDMVAMAMYGDVDKAEYILKFTGISNPFTLDKDDVLKIPNPTEVYGMMATNHPDEDPRNKDNGTKIRNRFKYYDPSLNKYHGNYDSYRQLEKMKIPSGRIQPKNPSRVMVPYISEDGRTSVTIRNGKIYFGENTGLNIAGQTITKTVTNATQA